MMLTQKLFDHFAEKAQQVKVSTLCIGLKYTAVTTDDGGIGIAFTYDGHGHCCHNPGDYRDFENRPAVELLECIKAAAPLKRSMGLALVNALNYHEADKLPEDRGDSTWMDAMGIGQGTRLAMVGLFKPLMHKFKERGAQVEVIDEHRKIGQQNDFYSKLNGWADALVLTSTSILNGSTEEVLSHLTPGVPVAMLGPSTPMVVAAFRHLPVLVLAGTVPEDHEAVVKAVRHGEGTPVIHRFSRKAYVFTKTTAA